MKTNLLDGDLAASREAVLGLALEAVLVHHADTHSYNTGDHRVALCTPWADLQAHVCV